MRMKGKPSSKHKMIHFHNSFLNGKFRWYCCVITMSSPFLILDLRVNESSSLPYKKKNEQASIEGTFVNITKTLKYNTASQNVGMPTFTTFPSHIN